MAECDVTIAVHGAITRAMTAAEVADSPTSATGALCALNRTGLVEVDDAPNWALPRRLETAVLSALSATPITACDLARRLFLRSADHRAKKVNPTLYALKARGEVVHHATRPPTWSALP